MGLSLQEDWSGLPFPQLQGIFPTQGLNPCLLHWQADSFPLSQQGSPPSLYPQAKTEFHMFIFHLYFFGEFSRLPIFNWTSFVF